MTHTLHIATIFAAIIALAVGDERCPNIAVAHNLDVKAYVHGRWFQQYHDKKNVFGSSIDMKCLATSYSSVKMDNKFTLYNQAIFVAKNFAYVTNYNGNITADKVLTLATDDQFSRFARGTLKVILTDNRTYVLAMLCGGSKNPAHDDYSIRLYTRCHEIPDVNLDSVKKFLKDRNIDVELVRVNHEDCH